MKKFIFLLSTVFLFLSCEKEYYTSDDPQEAILGKWELIESANDNGKLKLAKSKYEFFSDGTFKEFIETAPDPYNEQTGAYRIDSLYLYTHVTKELFENDDYPNIETYKFYKDKLRLEYFSGNLAHSMGTPTIFVYQRIK
jgi:hypothetical protein